MLPDTLLVYLALFETLVEALKLVSGELLAIVDGLLSGEIDWVYVLIEDCDGDGENDRQALWLAVSREDALKLDEPLDEKDLALVALALSDANAVDVYDNVDVPVLVPDGV